MIIIDDDLRIETYPRSTGSLAMSIQEGVKITHMPTGISASCDFYRHQHMARIKSGYFTNSA